MEKKISVILVNYNGKKYNDTCIGSILRSTVSEQVQVVVVDNASTDGSLAALQHTWGSNRQVHLIALEENFGFSRANNAGMQWSMEQGIEYFLLLNNDTEIEPDTIEKMFCCHRKTGAMVVPKVYYADRKDVIWCAGGDFTPVICKSVQRGLDQPEQGQFDLSGSCRFANGCALFLSKAIVDRIGFMDERFFLYYEDTEYSMRAAGKGVDIRYCAEAVVYHKVNGSTAGNARPANAYYITRNWLLCNSLHMRCGRHVNGRFLIFLGYFFCNRFAWMMIWLLQGKRKMCSALLRGVFDFCRGRWGKYQAG